MSLTINTYPTKQQTNAPEFNVTTSLVEGASYQNLRIRAKIYVAGQNSGEPVAQLEQKKGLDDWNFYNLLKSYIGKCNQAVGGSALMIQPTIGSELITSWSNYNGQFASWSATVNTINNASTGGNAITNTLSLAKGDLLAFIPQSDYSDTHATEVIALRSAAAGTIYHQLKYAGLSGGKLQANKMHYFLLTEDSYAGGALLQFDASTTGTLAGTFNLRKFTDLKNNPVAFFTVIFSEVYENSSDVTTTGDVEEFDTLMFIAAALNPGEDFDTDYLMDSSDTASFLNRAIVEGSVKYKYGIGMEIRMLLVYNEGAFIHSYLDNGTPTDGSNVITGGWAMIIINDNTITGISAATESFIIGINEQSDDWINSRLTIECLMECNSNLRSIAFVGDLGEETLVFRGENGITGRSEKTFFKNQNRIRKTSRAHRMIKHILRTKHETEEFNEVLHELTYTENEVWMYDEDETSGYKEVGVITDAVEISDGSDLITNEIEIEYHGKS